MFPWNVERYHQNTALHRGGEERHMKLPWEQNSWRLTSVKWGIFFKEVK